MKMRRIPLREMPEVKDGNKITDPKLEYRPMLMDLLNHVDPRTGIPIAEIERRLAMRKSLKDAQYDEWLLSEEEWQTIKGIIQAERWVLVSENLAIFVQDVTGAEEVEVKAYAADINR